MKTTQGFNKAPLIYIVFSILAVFVLPLFAHAEIITRSQTTQTATGSFTIFIGDALCTDIAGSYGISINNTEGSVTFTQRKDIVNGVETWTAPTISSGSCYPSPTAPSTCVKKNICNMEAIGTAVNGVCSVSAPSDALCTTQTKATCTVHSGTDSCSAIVTKLGNPTTFFGFPGNYTQGTVSYTQEKCVIDGREEWRYPVLVSGTCTPPPQPDQKVNGFCGIVVDACVQGTFLSQPDNNTQNLWSCSGSNGGSNALCISEKSTNGTVTGTTGTTNSNTATGGTVVRGCMDRAATNFNLNATINEGCIFSQSGGTHPKTCGSELNSCTTDGEFIDVPDSQSYYEWNCKARSDGYVSGCIKATGAPYVAFQALQEECLIANHYNNCETHIRWNISNVASPKIFANGVLISTSTHSGSGFVYPINFEKATKFTVYNGNTLLREVEAKASCSLPISYIFGEWDEVSKSCRKASEIEDGPAELFGYTHGACVDNSLWSDALKTCVPYSHISTATPEVTSVPVQDVLTNGSVNLSSDVMPILKGSMLQGRNVEFVGQAKNVGTTPVTATFVDVFSFRWGVTGDWIEISAHNRSEGVDPGEVLSDRLVSFPISVADILQIRHCVDARNTIVESDESDNCRINTFRKANTVATEDALWRGITGTLTVESNNVALNGSTRISWTLSMVSATRPVGLKCKIAGSNGQVIDVNNIRGTTRTSDLAQDTEYSYECSGTTGSKKLASVSINVYQPGEGPATVALTISPDAGSACDATGKIKNDKGACISTYDCGSWLGLTCMASASASNNAECPADTSKYDYTLVGSYPGAYCAVAQKITGIQPAETSVPVSVPDTIVTEGSAITGHLSAPSTFVPSGATVLLSWSLSPVTTTWPEDLKCSITGSNGDKIVVDSYYESARTKVLTSDTYYKIDCGSASDNKVLDFLTIEIFQPTAPTVTASPDAGAPCDAFGKIKNNSGACISTYDCASWIGFTCMASASAQKTPYCPADTPKYDYSLIGTYPGAYCSVKLRDVNTTTNTTGTTGGTTQTSGTQGTGPTFNLGAFDLPAGSSDFTVPKNSTVTIKWWQMSGAVRCVASGDWSGTKAIPATFDENRSEQVNVGTINKNYVLTCYDKNNIATTKSRSIQVK